MPTQKIKRKIVRLSTGVRVGGSAAFRNKDNAMKYARLVRSRGFRTETIRSTGPVIEGGTAKAYYVAVVGRKVTKRKKTAKKRKGAIFQGPRRASNFLDSII